MLHLCWQDGEIEASPSTTDQLMAYTEFFEAASMLDEEMLDLIQQLTPTTARPLMSVVSSLCL